MSMSAGRSDFLRRRGLSAGLLASTGVTTKIVTTSLISKSIIVCVCVLCKCTYLYVCMCDFQKCTADIVSFLQHYNETLYVHVYQKWILYTV